MTLLRSFTRSLVGLTLCATASLAAAQGSFPSKPLTIVVPVAPGSSTDLLARLLAEKLPARIGQPVQGENRPGASGLIGASQVARAAPDGHTLLLSASTLFIAPHVLGKGAGGNVDVFKDLLPIARVGSSPMLLVANPQLGVKDVAGLVASVKAAPGLAYATSGNGSPMHIFGEVFAHAAGIRLTHVPYKGAMPAAQDTVAGQVKLAVSALGGIGPFITSGKLVPLAVAGERSALLPGVPSLAEQGFSNVDIAGPWFALMAPAGTPAAVVERLNTEAVTILAMSDVRERALAAGVEARSSCIAEAQQAVRDDDVRYARLVAQFGIKGE